MVGGYKGSMVRGLLNKHLWLSDFFGRDIAELELIENAQSDFLFPDFTLIQTKLPSSAVKEIQWLQKQGFQFVEGEIIVRKSSILLAMDSKCSEGRI